MKTYYWSITLLLALFIVSCTTETKETDESTPEHTTEAVEAEKELSYSPFEIDYDTLLGVYSGDFGGSQIRISITYCSSKKVVGYNIHKGLMRNISGKVEHTPEGIVLNLEEPGDHPYDGVFRLLVDPSTFNIQGEWKHFGGEIPSKKIKLEKFVIENDEKKSSLTQQFLNSVYSARDTLGTLFFEQDGLVTYSYYPREGIEQLQTFSGTWYIKQKRLYIEWEKNPVFPSRKSDFSIDIEKEYAYIRSLTMKNGRIFWTEYDL